MRFKAIRMIMLLTLLCVAGQLTAFNQHCDMSTAPESGNTLMGQFDTPHHSMEHSQHNTEDTGQTVMTMPCCDMTSGCDMATCLAIMLNANSNQAVTFIESNLISLYKPNFRSYEFHSFYKPPILS